MMETSQTDKPVPTGYSRAHWNLLFAVRRSIRYHRRRERWLDGAHNLGALTAAVSGSATVAALLAGINPLLVTIAAAATAIAGAIELVFGLAKKARLHNELARDFIGLEQGLVRAGESLSEPDLREFVARRLDIESREPPALRVLDAMCHDELVTALGIEARQRSDPKWYQRWLANIVDVGAQNLRKHASR